MTAGSMHVSISVKRNELTNVLASDLIPRNIFTEYLSRSIRLFLLLMDLELWIWLTSFGVAGDTTQVVYPSG